MPRQHNRIKRIRKPKRRGIRLHRNYTVEEVARITGCAKGTIRRWIKSGALPALTDRKPNLVLGGDLADHLRARASSGPKLQLHECYCFKCRAPRSPALGIADYRPLTSTTGNLRALCGVCTTVMHKAIQMAALVALNRILEVTVQQATEHLIDTDSPSLNDHFAKERESHAQTPPAKRTD